MTADNVIAGYASNLILDMYQCAKLGRFKGYINWFAAYYQQAVEERKLTEIVIVKKPQSIGATSSNILQAISEQKTGIKSAFAESCKSEADALKQQGTLDELRKAFAPKKAKFVSVQDIKQQVLDTYPKNVRQMYADALEKEALAEIGAVIEHLVLTEVKSSKSSAHGTPHMSTPLTVKCHPDGTTEYGYDPTKGTPEQAADDLVKRYTDVFGANATAASWPLPVLRMRAISTSKFDLSTNYTITGIDQDEVR